VNAPQFQWGRLQKKRSGLAENNYIENQKLTKYFKNK